MFLLGQIEADIREQAMLENDTRILALSDEELHRIVMDIARDFLIKWTEERSIKNG